MCMCCLYSIPVMIPPITFRMIMYVRRPVMMSLNRVLVCDSVLQEIQAYMPAMPVHALSIASKPIVCVGDTTIYTGITRLTCDLELVKIGMKCIQNPRELLQVTYISSPCTFVTASVPIFRISVHDAWYHMSLSKYRARLIKYRLQKRKTWCRKWRDQSSDQAIILLHISKSD